MDTERRFGQRGRPNNPLEYSPDGRLYQGSAIRQQRQERQITLRQFAAMIEYDPGWLSNIENNRTRVTPEALKVITEKLELPEDRFDQTPLHPNVVRQIRAIQPQELKSGNTVFSIQIEKIMNEYNLTQNQRECAEHIIVDLTRSVCMGLKEMSIKEQASMSTRFAPPN